MMWKEALKALEAGMPAVAREGWPEGKCVVEAGDEVRFNDLSGSGPTYEDKDATDWVVVPEAVNITGSSRRVRPS